MPVQSGIKTPGIYTSVNTNTQRVGLPQNTHKVVLVSLDNGEFEPVTSPVAVYDRLSADERFGTDSEAGRMIHAALKTNRLIDAYALPLAVDTVEPT